MNKLQRLLGIGAIGLATMGLGGCNNWSKIEYSSIKHENAVVVSKNHIPSETRSTVGIAITNSKGGFGIGANGAGFGIGGLNFSSETDPEQNYITFDGNIDFRLNNKKLFNSFNLGDLVDISYTEEYKAFYDLGDLIRREFRGYEFVDAQPVN